jgi:iron complex outermembrane receptor protein
MPQCHEHYSDFGDTTVFKVTSRYDFSKAVAIRGTISTGFRAPTLAEALLFGHQRGAGFAVGHLRAQLGGRQGAGHFGPAA